MNELKITAAVVAALCGTYVFAQQDLVGRYKASWEVNPPGKSRSVQASADLEIKSVEGGKISGTLTRHMGSCRGSNPVEGKLEEGKLQLATVQTAGSAPDCNTRLSLTPQGNKLAGQLGSGTQVEFTK